jgi:hypothetical protein
MNSRLLTAASRPVLVDARALAHRLNVSRAFVYEHADELGAIPLGTGPRPRLRFDLEEAIACYTSRRSSGPDSAQQQASSRRRRRPLGTSVELLPIRGRIPRESGSREAA